MRLPPGTEDERIRHALKLALSREPKAGELESCGAFLIQQRESYKARPNSQPGRQGSSIREIPPARELTDLYAVSCAFRFPECRETPTKPTIPKAFL